MVESVIYSSFGEYGDFIPNDTDLNSQWHLPVINAYKAWDITTGSANIIVAILDSGTDWMHPDLGLGSDIYQNIYRIFNFASLVLDRMRLGKAK